MLEYNPILELPRVEDLPCSDETPVDSELQILIPTLLQILLNLLWTEREDWFFGLNMGIYHTTGQNPRIPIVPDGFLSIGVSRRRGETGRLSYITWQENNITPIWQHSSRTFCILHSAFCITSPKSLVIQPDLISSPLGSLSSCGWRLSLTKGRTSVDARNRSRNWKRERNLSKLGARMALLV